MCLCKLSQFVTIPGNRVKGTGIGEKWTVPWKEATPSLHVRLSCPQILQMSIHTKYLYSPELN